MYKKYLKSFYLKHLISSARYLKSPAVENHYWFILMSNLTPNKKKKIFISVVFLFFFLISFFWRWKGLFTIISMVAFFSFFKQNKKKPIYSWWVCVFVCVCVCWYFLFITFIVAVTVLFCLCSRSTSSRVYVIYLFTLFFCYFTDWWHTY